MAQTELGPDLHRATKGPVGTALASGLSLSLHLPEPSVLETSLFRVNLEAGTGLLDGMLGLLGG